MGFAGSDLFPHLRQGLHNHRWGGPAAVSDLDEGFKASLNEAPALAKFQYETPNHGWLWRYYLRRNKDLIETYWRVYNFCGD